MLPRSWLQTTHVGRERKRDISSWQKSHSLSPVQEELPLGPLELLAALLWALPTQVPNGLSLRVGAGSGPGLPAQQCGLLKPPTDWLTHLLAHPSPKVWVLSGNGLISSTEAWRVHTALRRLSRLLPFSPAMRHAGAVLRWCQARGPERVRRGQGGRLISSRLVSQCRREDWCLQHTPSRGLPAAPALGT